MFTFAEATDYLAELVDYEKRPAQTSTARFLNLDRMYAALDRVGNPHRQLRSVHIAGTKGKGSTAAMVAAILQAGGLRTALFAKPHLVTIRERLRIDGVLIREDEFAALVDEIRPVVEAMRNSPDGVPTFFEAHTLMAMLWFARQQVDIAVFETGLGGRLDATNVLLPLVTAITTLALDHTQELGETLVEIAGEKAGIIKPGVPVVSAPQVPEAAVVVAVAAGERGCRLLRVGEEIQVNPSPLLSPTRQRFSITGVHGNYLDLACPLLGEHQQLNAAVAVGIVECLQAAGVPVPSAAIRSGLATVDWPGRLQVMRERPLLLLDGAHDPAAVDALLAALDRHFPGRARHFLLGFASDKDWVEMLRQLAPSAATLTFTAAGTARAVRPETLAEQARIFDVPVTVAPDIVSALEPLLARVDPADLVCVTGSLYLVGDALKWWQQRGGNGA